MAKIFELTADIKEIADAAISDLIEQLGKPCQLVYPPIFVPCNDCGSSNRWVTGGPLVSFPDGSICPMCNGAGKVAQEMTDTITMLIANNPAHFFVKLPFVQVPAGNIQTKGYITDLPKVMQAKQMILQPSFPYSLRYVLDGEPIDQGNIIQGRYFVAFWKRAG